MGLAPTSRSFAFRQVHIIRFQDGVGISFSRQGVGDAVQDLNAEDDPPAELIETGRLHAGNDAVGTSEVLSQLHTMRHQTGALHD
jgi:hypothetical protein